MLNNSIELISFNYNFISRAELKTCQTTRCTIVYEAIRLINGIPLFWEGHWIRLQNSLKAVKSKVKIDQDKFEQALADLIQQNAYLNTNIRIEIFEENVLIYGIQTQYPDIIQYKHGVELNFIETIRPNPTRKIMRREWRNTMEQKINSAGVYESLLINNEGLITEGSHTNVFFIRDNVLYSAEESLILPGITRLEILRISKKNLIPVKYISLQMENISIFDAAFLSATSLHILPIAKINDYTYNVNNALLRSLMLDFENHINKEMKQASIKWSK